MDLIEIERELRLRREEAAARLCSLADSLSRTTRVEFVREGISYRVDVPDHVTMAVELEVGGDDTEIEISW